MLEPGPEPGVAQSLTPVAAQFTVEEVRPGLVQERGDVDAVGHEAHGVVFGPDLRPLVGTQARRHDAVNAAHRVHMPGAVQREARHVEHPGRRRRASKLEEALDRDTELFNEITEVREDEVVAERVVTGGDRCMRGEYAARGDRFQRCVELQRGGQVLA